MEQEPVKIKKKYLTRLPPFTWDGSDRDWSGTPVQSADASELPIAYLTSQLTAAGATVHLVGLYANRPRFSMRRPNVLMHWDAESIAELISANPDYAARADALGLIVTDFPDNSAQRDPNEDYPNRNLLTGLPARDNGNFFEAVDPEQYTGGRLLIVPKMSSPDFYISVTSNAEDEISYNAQPNGAYCSMLTPPLPAGSGSVPTMVPNYDPTFTLDETYDEEMEEDLEFFLLATSSFSKLKLWYNVIYSEKTTAEVVLPFVCTSPNPLPPPDFVNDVFLTSGLTTTVALTNSPSSINVLITQAVNKIQAFGVPDKINASESISLEEIFLFFEEEEEN